MLNRLIENIIADKNNEVGFDLSKSYLSNIAKNKNPDINLPVVAKKSSWDKIDHNNKAFLSKTYVFKNKQHMQYFLNEHLNKSEKNNYEPEVFIKGKTIKVYLSTELINDITERDIEYSKFLDEIYEDIFYI
tara:strand:- start:12019 stop:12414 length:396 start_codon:yes stop_codon:yes gene_type:complete